MGALEGRATSDCWGDCCSWEARADTATATGALLLQPAAKIGDREVEKFSGGNKIFTAKTQQITVERRSEEGVGSIKILVESKFGESVAGGATSWGILRGVAELLRILKKNATGSKNFAPTTPRGGCEVCCGFV